MPNENNSTTGSGNSQGSESSSGNNDSGNDRDIPIVPPRDRTNLNETVIRDDKTFIPPSTKED